MSFKPLYLSGQISHPPVQSQLTASHHRAFARAIPSGRGTSAGLLPLVPRPQPVSPPQRSCPSLHNVITSHCTLSEHLCHSLTARSTHLQATFVCVTTQLTKASSVRASACGSHHCIQRPAHGGQSLIPCSMEEQKCNFINMRMRTPALRRSGDLVKVARQVRAGELGFHGGLTDP